MTSEFWNRYLKVHQYEGLFHHVYSTVKGKQHLNYGSMHSQHLLDESQRWKHKKNKLNRFLCSHCWLWTSKCQLGVASKNGYDLCYFVDVEIHLRRNRFVKSKKKNIAIKKKPKTHYLSGRKYINKRLNRSLNQSLVITEENLRIV